jgi:hypothetical protein
LWPRLKQSLRELRRRGVQNPQVDDLGALLEVAERLVPEGATPAAQVVAVLELAIQDYASDPKTANPANAQKIAQLWFGLDPDTRARDHKERHKAAADSAGVTVGSFESHRAPKIIDSLAIKLASRYDMHQAEAPTGDDPKPSTDGNRNENEKAGKDSKISSPAPRQSTMDYAREEHVKRARPHIGRLPLVIGSVVLLAICLYIFTELVDNGSPQKALLPPPGSVVNAISGEVEGHPAIRGTKPGGAQIVGGPNFRACNLSAKAPCSYPLRSQPIAAHAGDIINFKLRVYNPMAEPLPYAKFYVDWGEDTQHPRQLQIEMEIEWPYAHNAGVGRPPSVELVTLVLPTTSSSANLVYMPGSTVLLDRTGRVIGSLPNGIMGRGVALTDIGSPPSCFECDLTYTRFIAFEAKVK